MYFGKLEKTLDNLVVFRRSPTEENPHNLLFVILNVPLSTGINRTRRFAKDKQRRVLNHSAGNSETLFLPAGHVRTALDDLYSPIHTLRRRDI
jgi:hypothetical protein